MPSDRAPIKLFAINVDTGDLTNGESNLNKIEPSSLVREFSVLTHWQNLDERKTIDLGARTMRIVGCYLQYWR